MEFDYLTESNEFDLDVRIAAIVDDRGRDDGAATTDSCNPTICNWHSGCPMVSCYTCIDHTCPTCHC